MQLGIKIIIGTVNYLIMLHWCILTLTLMFYGLWTLGSIHQSQMPETVRARCPLGCDAGPHSCSICLYQQPSNGLETTPWSSATNVASYHWERPPRTEYGTVDCLVLRKGSCSVAKSRGNSYAPVGARDMMMMMINVLWVYCICMIAVITGSYLFTVSAAVDNRHWKQDTAAAEGRCTSSQWWCDAGYV